MTWKITGAPGTGEDLLYSQAGTPTLDLRFASSKSLNDNVSGQNLIDFTRGGNGVGTYVGSDGLIKNSVVNLLLRSEEFDQSPWTISAPVTVTIDNSQGNPVNGANVYRVDFTGSNQNGPNQNRSYSTGLHSAFIWIKGTAGETIRFSGQSGVPGGAVNFTLNGNWQKLVLPAWTASSTVANFNVNTFDNVTARTVYIAAAQLEQSSTAGEYVKTTSSISGAPRFDHDPETGESLGLLIEEQRTNLALQSEEFGTSPWSASNVTVTANQEVAPSAATTADTLAATGANGTVTQPITTTAVTMTFSVYLKRKTGTGNVDITADGTTWVTQTISSNAWTRCVVTQTAVAGTSNPGIRLVSSGDEVFAWGAQFE